MGTLFGRLKEIDSKIPVQMSNEDIKSLNAADAQDDGTEKNINDLIKEHRNEK